MRSQIKVVLIEDETMFRQLILLTLGKVKLNQTEQPVLFAKPTKISDTAPVNLAEMRSPAQPSRYGRGDLPR